MKNKIISLIVISLLTFSLKLQANENNWKPAQEGDKIIMIRHALAPGTGDPNGFKINDCSTQRNLDEIGISQSKKIGKLFKEKKIKIDQVLSSQWCRCKDTAKFAFENYKEFPALNPPVPHVPNLRFPPAIPKCWAVYRSPNAKIHSLLTRPG